MPGHFPPGLLADDSARPFSTMRPVALLLASCSAATSGTNDASANARLDTSSGYVPQRRAQKGSL